MFMDRYPAELSGGQQQRVAIARTLAPEPTVLFMDEPLSNLDAKLRLEMRYELQRLHVETGSTFVYVTHDQMEAMTLATQICLIDNGVLQQYDAPLTVYGKPNNLFVADFVGNPSINFVEAKGVQKGEQVELTVFDGCKATFVPNEPLDLAAWFAERDEEETARAAALKEKAAQKGYVEKGNKDEPFRYHIARVDEIDESLLEDPVLTNEDLVLGIRPEFIDIDHGQVEGEIYGAMPTGMESTIKVRLGDYLLTGVVFGSNLFTIGEKVKLSFKGEDILLFDRKSGKRIGCICIRKFKRI
jgi:ABC-type sugar transport system ATPase subunit